MTEPRVPFARPDITEEEISAVFDVLRSGWLTTGDRVRAFEKEFAAAASSKHAVALNSGTAALHLALEAFGVGPGDEVILPSYTFTATAEVVRYLDAIPVIVDVRAQDLTIDPGAVERALTERTKAVIGVDLAGVMCDWARLATFRTKTRRLLDDAAHSLPGAVGSLDPSIRPDASAYSFYVTKPITTGEGGMLATDDPAVASRVRLMSLHGLSGDAWKRYDSDGSWQYDVVEAGYKYNLTDIAAALGLVQLKRSSEMARRRAEIAEAYSSRLRDVAEIERPPGPTTPCPSWHLYMIRLHLEKLRCPRDRFIADLRERGVQASVHFIPLSEFTYWRSSPQVQWLPTPVASAEWRRVVSLPIFSGMADTDVDFVAETVRDVCRHWSR